MPAVPAVLLYMSVRLATDCCAGDRHPCHPYMGHAVLACRSAQLFQLRVPSLPASSACSFRTRVRSGLRPEVPSNADDSTLWSGGVGCNHACVRAIIADVEGPLLRRLERLQQVTSSSAACMRAWW